MATATTDRLLRLSEVRTRTALGRSTIYRKMRDGSFPEPLKIGAGAVPSPPVGGSGFPPVAPDQSTGACTQARVAFSRGIGNAGVKLKNPGVTVSGLRARTSA